jgi:glycosyltransferase involved in cell wall biosynthesis
MTTDRTQAPLVSVVIPAYNGQEYIREAIESVLAQTYRPIEVLVVDDGSPISMEEAVSGFGPEVRYLRQKNGGTASARNLGLRSSNGEFIALLDQDDLWLPRKLERQVPRFAEDPRIGLVTAWMEVFDSATGETKGTFYPAAEMTVHDILGHELPPVQTMIFRRSALEKIGGFDASLRGTDDWDVNIRIAAEYRVVTVGEVLGRAREHSSQQGSNGEQMYRNSMRVLNKHRNVHANCAECRQALRKSRRLVREYHCDFIKGRARAAWNEGHYPAAITRAARAFWQHPPLFTQALGRALRGH